MPGEYHGLPTGTLQSRHIQLDYLTTAGPRLVRLWVDDSPESLFAELTDPGPDTGYGTYNIRGGHRLWHAPEAWPRSYLPDNDGLVAETFPAGVRLRQPAEAGSGIAKTMEVELDPDRPVVQLRHYLRNEGPWPVELAPWALTMCKPGGIAILPQTQGTLDTAGLLPNRHLVLWPYTQLRDPRLDVYDDLALLHVDPDPVVAGPCKLGCLNRRGWVAYLRAGVLFRKRFTPQPAQPHPDYNCNSECYCSRVFVELETLGPTLRLEPGESVRHDETWEFTTGITAPQTIEGIRDVVAGLGL